MFVAQSDFDFNIVVVQLCFSLLNFAIAIESEPDNLASICQRHEWY